MTLFFAACGGVIVACGGDGSTAGEAGSIASTSTGARAAGGTGLGGAGGTSAGVGGTHGGERGGGAAWGGAGGAGGAGSGGASAGGAGGAMPTCVPGPEVCNGLDDDCDGLVDDGLGGIGVPCTPCPDVGLGPGAGTIHYVCDCDPGADPDCSPGDDLASGLTPDTPWRTAERARQGFGTIAAGDTIAFCRGGVFPIQQGASTRWVNASCKAGTPCVIRDYAAPWASGDEANPRLETRGGDRGLSFEDGGPSDHEEGYTVLHLDVKGTGLGTGLFLYNDIDDVLLCDVNFDSFTIGVQVAGSNAPNPGSDGVNSRIVLRNSRITNNSGQGYLGACEACVIDHDVFENNGFGQAIFNHNIYLSAHGAPVTGMRVTGNELHRAANVNGKCQGVSLVVHGSYDDLLIEGNRVTEDVGAAAETCWGIAVDTAYGEPESFKNVAIRGNEVTNVGNVSIGLDACAGCVVENNVVVNTQAMELQGIAIPDRAREAQDLPLDAVVVRNNSVYLGPDAHGPALRVGGDGTGHVVVSNAVYLASALPGTACLGLGGADPKTFALVDANVCNAASGVTRWETAAGDLASWQAATGFDAHSKATDPGFASLAGPPYDLSAKDPNGPLHDAGDPTHSAPDDIWKRKRVVPDVGAFESP